MAAAAAVTLLVLFTLSAFSPRAAFLLGGIVLLGLLVRIGFLIRKEL
jgi:hypothetical protein